MANNPPPYAASILQLDPRSSEPAKGYPISKEWGQWLQNALVSPISTSVQTYPSVTLTAQGAAIGVTPIPLPTLPSGLYRLTYYARITTAGSISSSLTINFGWTESGIALSASGAAITGNTTTTVGSQSLMILSDAASPITYSTTYASNAAGMTYKLQIKMEAL